MKRDAARRDHGLRYEVIRLRLGTPGGGLGRQSCSDGALALTASRRLPARLGSRWLAAGCEVQKAEALQNRYLIPTATTFEVFGANAPQ
jgi:hypothetical protein